MKEEARVGRIQSKDGKVYDTWMIRNEFGVVDMEFRVVPKWSFQWLKFKLNKWGFFR